MSGEVLNFGKAAIESSRRESFLRAVAQSFEAYVAEHGYEPDAIVYVLNGTHQVSRIGWQVEGPSMGGVVSVLSLAAVHALKEAGESRQGLPQ